MMKQFKTILGFELKYYFKNKLFVGVTVFLAAVIALVMFFPRIADAFENNAASADGRPVMLVAADTDENAAYIGKAFSQTFADYEVVTAKNDEKSIKSRITEGDAECAFVFKGLTAYTYYVDNLSLYDYNTAAADAVIQDMYRVSALTESGIPADRAGQIMAMQPKSETVNLGVDQMQNFFYTYIMIFALYMVIMLYGQMVAINVASEKSSRAMEVLITSAKPVSMMFGKVIASCIAGFVQLICVFGSAFVFFNLNKSYWAGNEIVNSIFNIPADLLIYMLLFFLLGFFIYAFMYGAVGSTASKLEDVNTSVLPITFLFIGAFIVVMYSMGAGDMDSLLMKVCSYIPFTSPMAMFTRIAMSTVPFYEIAISVAILIGSVFGIGVLSAKIYRVGVLLYGTTPKLGSIIKTVFKA
ncbi:MAG: ABC transporter permease [Acutalibacteraceae bacterium]